MLFTPAMLVLTGNNDDLFQVHQVLSAVVALEASCLCCFAFEIIVYACTMVTWWQGAFFQGIVL